MRIQDHEDIVYAFDEFLKSGQCKSLWDIKSKWKQLLSEYYDIQETNRITPASASVQNIYFDYYDNYYLINGSLKATYEHPFFVIRDGSYHFKTTTSLLPGDKLFKTNNEFETIESVLFVNESLETVNLNVEDLDVYFGGGYLMHNVHGKS